METFLAVLSFLALLCSLSFFIMFIGRALKKQKKRQYGMIALVSFAISITVATIGSQLYPVEDKEAPIKQNIPKESETIISSKNEESEIIVSPKNGRKLKVMGETLTFRIGEIIQDSLGIHITLQSNDAIPLLDSLEAPVKMKIVIDNQTLESRNPQMSGLFKNRTLQGNLTFSFPATKIPNEVIVYNRDNQSIKFTVKNK